MEQKPFELRQQRVRALLGARVYGDRRGPQGKATVDSIVAGVTFTRGVQKSVKPASKNDSAFPRVRALRTVAKALWRVGDLEPAVKQTPQEHAQHGR
jgi:hypothetical protein